MMTMITLTILMRVDIMAVGDSGDDFDEDDDIDDDDDDGIK